MSIKEKMRMYNGVFLPTVTYCSQIWYAEVSKKRSYMDKVIRLQRRMIRTISGSYKNASSEKLLEIVKAIPIDEELEILNKTKECEKEIRTETRREMRRDRLNSRPSRLNVDEQFDTLAIKMRETVWCLTEAGPFGEYLYKYNLIDDPTCRFCRIELETVRHLLNCEYLDLEHLPAYDTKTVEKRISILFKELRKFNN